MTSYKNCVHAYTFIITETLFVNNVLYLVIIHNHFSNCAQYMLFVSQISTFVPYFLHLPSICDTLFQGTILE